MKIIQIVRNISIKSRTTVAAYHIRITVTSLRTSLLRIIGRDLIIHLRQMGFLMKGITHMDRGIVGHTILEGTLHTDLIVLHFREAFVTTIIMDTAIIIPQIGENHTLTDLLIY